MVGALGKRANWMTAAMLLLAVAVSGPLFAQQRGNGGERGGDRGGGRGPVYQRHAYDRTHIDRGRGRGQYRPNYSIYFQTPQVNAGWFQRPYPYHLDYYRMRYGGSYAPYFGNLYGTPQVVTVPPYYGPYYGGNVGAYGGYGYGTSVPPDMTLPSPAEEVAE